MASSGASEAECRRVEEALRKERDRGRSIVTSNTGKRLKSYLKSLCQRAKELGASAAVAIPVTDVVVDERAMLKCVVPLCSFYATNLMCPPNVMPVSEFKNILKSYRCAILIKIDSVSSRPPEELTGLNNLSEAWQAVKPAIKKEKQPATSTTEYFHTLRDNQERLCQIINQMELNCFAEGYRFAAGLSAGGCFLCDECVGVNSGLPCRYPFKARPSMEAMGIDVVATAERAGMQLYFARNETRSWVGLILVD